MSTTNITLCINVQKKLQHFGFGGIRRFFHNLGAGCLYGYFHYAT